MSSQIPNIPHRIDCPSEVRRNIGTPHEFIDFGRERVGLNTKLLSEGMLQEPTAYSSTCLRANRYYVSRFFKVLSILIGDLGW